MKCMLNVLPAVMMLLLLSACETGAVKDQWGSVSGYFKADRTEGLEGTLIELVAEPDSGAATFSDSDAETGFAADIDYLRYGNKTRANLPQLEAYSNKVLDRLTAQWPGRRASVRVYITPSPDFQAYTLEHGAIFVSLGSLQIIRNEDELAALLAHEFSHAALRHHSKDVLEKFSNTAFRFANLYLQTRMESGRDVQNRARALKVAGWVSEKALFPSWNSGQENEADILGTDLLVRAGYNADAMIAVLKKVQATAQQKQEFIAENPIKVDRDSSDTPVLLSVDLELFAKNVVGSLEDSLAKQYAEAAERQKRVREYLKREYRQRERPELDASNYQAVLEKSSIKTRVEQYQHAFRAEEFLLEDDGVAKAAAAAAGSIGGAIGDDPYTRMLMYRIRNFQNEARKANINLQKAYDSSTAPMYTYELLVDKAVKQSDYSSAESLLQEMDRIFDQPAEILPNLIQVTRKLEKPSVTYELRCIVSADVELIKRCSQAKEI